MSVEVTVPIRTLSWGSNS